MPNDLLEQLSALLNLPDLIIIAAVLVNMILGFRRGFFGSLYGLVGRIIALAASYFAARAAAPYIASWVVTPMFLNSRPHSVFPAVYLTHCGRL